MRYSRTKGSWIKTYLLRGFYIAGMMSALLFMLYDWKMETEPDACFTPDYPLMDLAPVLGGNTLTDDDYELLFMQTGLGKGAVKELKESGRLEDLYEFQENFFRKPALLCEKNSPVSWEEEMAAASAGDGLKQRLIGLEDGDILITPCSHTFGWRNGHAALVVDAMEGKTLEAVVLGEDSCIQSVDKWKKYPAVMVLRLSAASQEERAMIAKNAAESLVGISYGFTVGLLSPKHPGGQVTQTHCSHLIWEAYREFGYDLDCNKGPVVTPRDIANSPLLEVRQVCGMNPRKLWKK